ncbi:hypothetical protein [Mesorhizobium sp. f-mel]
MEPVTPTTTRQEAGSVAALSVPCAHSSEEKTIILWLLQFHDIAAQRGDELWPELLRHQPKRALVEPPPCFGRLGNGACLQPSGTSRHRQTPVQGFLKTCRIVGGVFQTAEEVYAVNFALFAYDNARFSEHSLNCLVCHVHGYLPCQDKAASPVSVTIW